MSYSIIIKKIIVPLFCAIIFISCEKEDVGKESADKSTPPPSKVPTPPTTPPDNKYKGAIQEILSLVNEHRKALNKKTLILDDAITSVATQYSIDMANNRIPYSHEHIGFEKRAKTIDRMLNGFKTIGENIHHGFISPKQAVEDWLASPGHRGNIEGNYTLTGIGIAKAPNGDVYYTQIFVLK